MTPLGNSAIFVKSYTLNNGGKRLEGADLHFKEERYDALVLNCIMELS